MVKVFRVIRKCNRFLCQLAAFPLSFTAVITFADVIGRCFRFPIPGALELGQLLMVSVVYLALGHTQAQRGHVFLDISIPLPFAMRKIVDTFVILLGFFIVGILAWKTVPFVFAAYHHNEWSDCLHVPIFFFKAFMFIGSLTFCLQLIVDLFELWGIGERVRETGASK